MYYANVNEGNNTPAKITYTNMPVETTLNFLFADPIEEGAYGSGYSNNILTVEYSMAAGKNAYLLLAPLGLYNLHVPASANDTVDLSRMDTARLLSYNLPTGYTYSYTILTGIQDTTDQTKSLQVSDPLLTYPAGTQLELPSVAFQKYSGEVDATLGPGESGVYNYYGDSLQLNIPFFPAGSYTLNSIDMNTVDPVFSGTVTRYSTSWVVNPKTVMVVFSSPDSAQHPATVLNTLTAQSKLLKGTAVSSLSLNAFAFFNTDNLSYSEYCQKSSNYKVGVDLPLQKEISYYKFY